MHYYQRKKIASIKSYLKTLTNYQLQEVQNFIGSNWQLKKYNVRPT